MNNDRNVLYCQKLYYNNRDFTIISNINLILNGEVKKSLEKLEARAFARNYELLHFPPKAWGESRSECCRRG